MRNVRKWLWSIILIFHCAILYAKEPYTTNTPDPLTEKWRYTHFEELNDRRVRCIAKNEKENVYWFGLIDGIIKYDGIKWTSYSADDGLIGGAVSNVFVDQSGVVYATTSKGIFFHSEGQWKALFLAKDQESFVFTSITKLTDGSLFCTLNSGALLYSLGKFYFFSSGESTINTLNNHPELFFIKIPERASFDGNFNNFSHVFEVSPGIVWLAISKGSEGEIIEFNLNKAKEGKIEQYKLISSSGDFILGNDQKIFRDSRNKIWIINKSNKLGAISFSQNKWVQEAIGSNFGDDEYAVSITESTDGTIWIGGINKIYSYNNGKWKKYSAPTYNVPAAHITAFSNSSNELILLGYQSNVVKIDLSNDRWLTYLGLNYQCDMANGATWFVDVDGKAVYNFNESWVSYDRKDGLIEHPVRIFASSTNKVWAVGSDNGIAAAAYFENDKWHKVHFDSLSWGIDYRSVLESTDGSLWLGGSVDIDEKKGHVGGLIQILNPNDKHLKWKHHKYKENGLQQTSIYGIGQTKDGDIWIGGVHMHNYDGSVWHRTDNEYLNQFVNYLYSDKNKNLFIGSRYYGVFVYNNTGWKHYSTENGLLNNTIISICSGNRKMWVATEKDISYFNGQTWINNAFPAEMNLSNEGGSVHVNAEGHIWINHSLREWKRRAYGNRPLNEEVFAKYKVFRKTPNNTPPETTILIFSENVDNSGNTFISWKGDDFLNQNPSSILLYSYRLNDEPWSDFSKATNHTFTGLKNGNYSIEVRAMDIDGNIDPTPARAEFTVVPPVWKQTWFIVLIVGFLILISIFEYRIITKNRKLSLLNISLQDAINLLELKKKKIEKQNEAITKHQIDLEENNQLLESKNHEIEAQRDALKDLVVQIEDLARAKVKFFTNITHEFRTPLSLILGPIETLSKTEAPNPDRYNLYQIVKKNALRLQKLINQLLEIRRIETGTLELILRKENIVKFVRDIKELFNNQSMQKCIQFTFTSDVNNYDIYFDQDKIEKIVFNLLSNAFKYTQDYGKIAVSISVNNFAKAPLPVAQHEAQNYIVLKVKDTGKGIEAERLPGIFERFKSADINLAISNMQSTGIGLSYIKELIEFHEGHIYAESEAGKGTVFTILIPNYLQPTKLQSGNHELAEFDLSKSLDATLMDSENETDAGNGYVNGEKVNIEKYSILIVEDNEDMKSYLKSLLTDRYNIFTAKNGREGLEKLSEVEVDLIISDIMMPEFDGLKFCKEVKSNFETSHIPVFLLTAKSMKESELTGYESGADDYITKPFDPEILEIKIKNIFETREKLKTHFIQDFQFKPKDIKVSSPDEQLLNKMVELMEDNISDADFDVNKLCDMVNLSHMHFIRKVKQLTGKKPIDLLKSFRLQRAKQLLEQDKLNISEIAYMVGYDLPNSFSRAFKKEFGISPTEFVNDSRIKTG